MAVARNDAGTPNVANASATTLDLTTFVPLVGPATEVQTKTVLTCGQAVQVLAQRLYEYNVVPGPYQFWTVAELHAYLGEALQAFNVTANFMRREFAFALSINQVWYDLTLQANTLRPMTATDQQQLSLIEYHLLEPQTSTYPLTWTGTKQFTIADLLLALQQMHDQTVSESTCTVNRSVVAAVPGRTFLADTSIDLRRVCWIPGTLASPPYAINCLLDADLWATQSYQGAYQGFFIVDFQGGFPQTANGIPTMYRRSTEPPLSFDVDIQPAVDGGYDVLTTDTGQPLSSGGSTILQVPTDWAWVVKYGAMAQLFNRVDLAYDPVRSAYCWNRYKQGIAMMSEAPAALGARLNDVPIVVDAMSNGDFYDANWQGKPLGRPQYLYYSGMNMVAVSPAPDQIYSLTVAVLQNMPLCVSDGDLLPVGRADVQAVLDEAVHIAMIKCGGQEFTQTYALHTAFLRHCLLYNSKLKALSQWLEFLDGRTQEEILVNPVFDRPTVKEVQGGG